jgi:VanZ family protein
MRGLLARWGPALAVMAVIFAASSLPGEALPDTGAWDWPVRKSGHFLIYALLGAAYRRGLAWRRPASAEDSRWALLMALAYAVTDELHQGFSPDRSPSVRDVGIDTLGAAAGCACSAWWQARGRPRPGA